MRNDDHATAREWIDRETVEGLATADRERLAKHLEGCEECAAHASATGRALRALRSVPVDLPPGLAGRAQMRVYLRSRDQREPEHSWALWVSFALSWALGIATAPLVWRGLEWAGRTVGVSTVWLKLGFGMWWAVPAIVAAAIFLFEKKRVEER
jgi:anti-sigma factor RsiW